MSQILYPGDYFIELEFDRPVDPSVLHRALTAMGFGVVVFDQSQDTRAPTVGAATMASSASRYAAATRPAAVAVAKPAMSLAKAIPAAAPTLTSSKPTVIAVQSRYATPAAQATAKVADGGPPAVVRSSTMNQSSSKMIAQTILAAKKPDGITLSPAPSMSASPSGSAAALSTAPAMPTFPGDVPAVPGGASAASDGGGGGGGGGGGAPADGGGGAPAPDGGDAAALDPNAPDPWDAYNAAQGTPDPSATAATATSPVASSAPPPGTVEAQLTTLWTKWKEWGSPFALGPGGEGAINTSGVGGDDDPLRFRVLARLDVPIALDDRPGMRWLFVKKLAIPFLGDLMFQSTPFPLHQRSLYEMRFLSRAKSNPTRDSVKQSLTEMGFTPIKLSAIKRNMKLPGRPASLTLWYGMGVWNLADSVIVNDDPFFFETLKEIKRP